MNSERKQIDQITANNVALRDQYIVVGGETIQLPQPPALLAYLAKLRERYHRWADQPAPATPLFDQAPTPATGPDAYLAVDAKPLPMRLAEFRSQGTGEEAPAQELLTALGTASYSVILGEPGSGKTTALERLAWVYAHRSLAQAAQFPSTQNTLTAGDFLPPPILLQSGGGTDDSSVSSLLPPQFVGKVGVGLPRPSRALCSPSWSG